MKTEIFPDGSDEADSFLSHTNLASHNPFYSGYSVLDSIHMILPKSRFSFKQYLLISDGFLIPVLFFTIPAPPASPFGSRRLWVKKHQKFSLIFV